MKDVVIIGLVGPVLDQGKKPDRWERWRPTVGVCQQEELLVKRFELLYDRKYTSLLNTLTEDIHSVSPETEVVPREVNFADPWDFEEVYSGLHDFARAYSFDTDGEEYLIHITTGTHVAQICLFLLTEARYFPGRLLQTSPGGRNDLAGRYAIIDLDLSRYDRIAMRFRQEQRDDISFLKSGIETRNEAFNTLIERIERVGMNSTDPILLTGPTGAGKSQLARRIFELKQARRLVKGEFVEVNCATLRGEGAMSALFGHKKGAFTGAVQDRPGLLLAADKGVLFLDEVGELGLDEQSMLLRAIEEKRFLPLGADREKSSDFQLICGTNRDLQDDVTEGRFREDLLARINLWTFSLPGLKDRTEDIEPNLQYELERYAGRNNRFVSFSREAMKKFLVFAGSGEALWSANFRDLGGAVTRMSTLSQGGRITEEVVEEEIERLKKGWRRENRRGDENLLNEILGTERASGLDRFDRVQLADVLHVCRESKSLSEAGRILFSSSRQAKKSSNDADRLSKYLARFGLGWSDI